MAQPQSRPIRFAAIGLDHRHIYEMAGRLLELGGTCAGYWTDGEPQPLAGFIKRFPDIPRVADKRRLIEDSSVQMILTAAIPADRAAIAIEAMRAGKDVATDKPGCTTATHLVGELFGAVRGQGGDARAGTGARRRDRARRADRLARPAPAEPGAAA
jgi:predicted dehydrogenase